MAKWFKSYFIKSEDKKGTYLNFQPIFVDGALGEDKELYGENQILSKKEKDIIEKQGEETVALKEITVREITNLKFETLEGVTQEEFIKLVTSRKYRKK